MTVKLDLRLGRWQDVLIGAYDPARAVVVTDPPYGLGATVSTPSTDGRLDDYKGYRDDVPWAQHVAEVLELLPAKRHVIRGPATELVQRGYPQPKRICVETASYRRRANNRPGVVPYLWQGWAVYGKTRIERHRQPPSGDAIGSSTLLQRHEGDLHVGRTAHRALTPYASCLWIVDTWVDPGDVVIDPFAGHGTIGRAARQHGFDYVGAEMVPEFFEAASAGFGIERLTFGLETAP